ncbi:MAG: SRPBCC family protein [Ilumatobacteraceae bacterium]
MNITESVVVDAAPADVFPLVESLDRYPLWMRLVHDVEAVNGRDPAGSSIGDPAWSVELRARVGPFARSKRLRMVRTVHVPDVAVAFERAEIDGRDHARWALRVDLTSVGHESTSVQVHLSYDGRLWTGGVLERVLDDEVRRGREGLARLVSDGPTH